jgi:hypothetical protein
MSENIVAQQAREVLASQTTDVNAYRIALDLCATELSRLTNVNRDIVKNLIALTEVVASYEERDNL